MTKPYFLNSIFFYILCILSLAINAFSQNQQPQILDLTNDSIYTNSLIISDPGTSEIANFTVEPGYVDSKLFFQLSADSNYVDSVLILIRGWNQNNLVESWNIPVINDSSKVIQLSRYTTSIDKNISISYKIFLKVTQFKSSSPREISYKIKISNTIVSLNQLIYLGINIIFFFSIVILLRKKLQNKIINYSWEKSRWAKVVDHLARALIIIVIIDELGLFLREWGYDLFPFDLFRLFMELNGVGKIIFLANLLIIIPATYRLTLILLKKLENKSEYYSASISDGQDLVRYHCKYAFNVALFVLILTITFWNFQCFEWNEYDLSQNLNSVSSYLAAIILILPLVLFFILIPRISKLNASYKINPFDFRRNIKLLYLILTVSFLAFSQTMITKVLVLLPLINRFRKWASTLIKMIPPQTELSEHSLFPTSFQNNIKVFNFFLLTTSAFMLILIWQLSVTPYPPLNSKYNFTSTIGLFYTLYILLYFLFVQSDRYIVLKSILWWCITFSILYFLPIAYKELFFADSDSKSILNLIITYVGVWILFLLHIVLILNVYFLSLGYHFKYRFYLSGFKRYESLKKYILYAIYFPSFFIIFFFVIFIAKIYSIYRIKLGITFGIIPDINVLLAAILPSIFLFLPIITRQFKSIHNEIKRIAGSDVIERIRSNVRFLQFYKSWNNSKYSSKGILVYSLATLFTFSIFYSLMKLVPQLGTQTNYNIIWEKLLTGETQDIYTDMKETNKNIVLTGFNTICCLDKYNGSIKWSKSKDDPTTEFVNDSLFWIVDKSVIELININTGKPRYIKSFTNEVHGNDEKDFDAKQHFEHSEGFVLIKEPNKLLLLNDITGSFESVINRIDSPLPRLEGGPIVWKNNNNEVFFSKFEEGYIDQKISVGEIKDSLVSIFSTSDGVFIFSKNMMSLYNTNGEFIWSSEVEIDSKLANYIDCVVFQKTVVFCNGKSLFIFDRSNGELLNLLTGLNYANFFSAYPIPFNDQIVSNNFGFILLEPQSSDYEYIFFDQFGENKFRFSEDGLIPLTLQSASLYTINHFVFREYSITTGSIELEDFYQLLIKSKYPEFINYNPDKLIPYSFIVSQDKLFWANRRGVFAAEHNLYNNK